MAVATQQVTAEQILRDALFHIEEGWIQGEAIIQSDKKLDGKDVEKLIEGDSYPYEEPYETIYIDTDRTAKQIKKDIAFTKANTNVYVCSIGGIILARNLLEGSQKRSDDSPAFQVATALLAYIINNPQKRKINIGDFLFFFADGSTDDYEQIIVEFNDNKTTNKSKVRKTFSKAIDYAEKLKI